MWEDLFESLQLAVSDAMPVHGFSFKRLLRNLDGVFKKNVL